MTSSVVSCPSVLGAGLKETTPETTLPMPEPYRTYSTYYLCAGRHLRYDTLITLFCSPRPMVEDAPGQGEPSRCRMAAILEVGLANGVYAG